MALEPQVQRNINMALQQKAVSDSKYRESAPLTELAPEIEIEQPKGPGRPKKDERVAVAWIVPQTVRISFEGSGIGVFYRGQRVEDAILKGEIERSAEIQLIPVYE